MLPQFMDLPGPGNLLCLPGTEQQLKMEKFVLGLMPICSCNCLRLLVEDNMLGLQLAT
jgi:hypothetical protein